jgi:hypothetical protein
MEVVYASGGNVGPQNWTSYKEFTYTFIPDYYEKRLSEGKKKKQVIICIMRKLVNILYSMIKNKTEYRLTALPERAAS